MNKQKNFKPIALAIGLLLNSAVLMAQAPQPAPTTTPAPAAQTYPEPYDREGATKVFDNDRVRVWDVSWLPRAYPTHKHLYDYAGVYYTSGDRVIVSPQGQRSPTHTTAWDTFFFRKDVTHSEEGVGTDLLRGIFLELKEPAAVGGATTESTGLGKQAPGRPNNRLFTWQDIAEPGTQLQATPRKYENDAVVVAFKGQKPTITFVKRGTESKGKETAGMDRVYTFELK